MEKIGVESKVSVKIKTLLIVLIAFSMLTTSFFVSLLIQGITAASQQMVTDDIYQNPENYLDGLSQ